MSVTGRQLLHQAGDRLGKIEVACVRVDVFFGTVPAADLDGWLERMTFYDDFGDPEWTGSPVPRGHAYRLSAGGRPSRGIDHPRRHARDRHHQRNRDAPSTGRPLTGWPIGSANIAG